MGSPIAQGLSDAGEWKEWEKWEAAERAQLGWDGGILLWVEAVGQDGVSVRFLVALKAACIRQKTGVSLFFLLSWSVLNFTV